MVLMGKSISLAFCNLHVVPLCNLLVTQVEN